MMMFDEMLMLNDNYATGEEILSACVGRPIRYIVAWYLLAPFESIDDGASGFAHVRGLVHTLVGSS